MKEKKYGLIILCGFLLYAFLPLRAGKRVGQGSDIVSVIKHGIRNDGAVIGSELNELVTRSYGKTLYFPPAYIICRNPLSFPTTIRRT